MVIGMTGGIGCGKSTALSFLEREYLAKILMADELGHEALARGTACYDAIIQEFGTGILTETKEIDRDIMARSIYASDERREKLNSIIHPYVKERIHNQLKEWEKELLVVVETALMFETGCDKLCDEVWGIITDTDIRIKRLMENRGYPREKAEAIMQKQYPDDFFLKKCDRIIYNNKTPKELEKQIKELLHKAKIL